MSGVNVVWCRRFLVSELPGVKGVWCKSCLVQKVPGVTGFWGKGVWCKMEKAFGIRVALV